VRLIVRRAGFVLSVAALLAVAVPAPRARAAVADLALVSSLDGRAELSSPARAASPGDGGAPVKAFLLSAAVPGAAQIARGEKRGYAYLAVEVAFWAAFFSLNEKGLDERGAYEDYADAHWDFEGYSAWYETNCLDCNNKRSDDYACRPLAVYGTQEYYEDIGKYDTYWSWWSESGSGSGSPEHLDVRNEYWGMRVDSNRHLRQARYSMTAAFLNHIASGVDAFLSARRGAADGPSDRGAAVGRRRAPDATVRFDALETGDGLSCALVVSY
jgi:hypothetical protein